VAALIVAVISWQPASVRNTYETSIYFGSPAQGYYCSSVWGRVRPLQWRKISSKITTPQLSTYDQYCNLFCRTIKDSRSSVRKSPSHIQRLAWTSDIRDGSKKTNPQSKICQGSDWNGVSDGSTIIAQYNNYYYSV